MARLVKAGTPRALPADGRVHCRRTALAGSSREAAGKKAEGARAGKPAKTPDARSARRENCPCLPGGGAGLAEPQPRTHGAGESNALPRASQRGTSLPAQYFPALADRPAVVHGGGVLLPVPFPQTNLHVLRAGVFVGSVQKGRFVPEHHLFTAFGAQCTNREELTLD